MFTTTYSPPLVQDTLNFGEVVGSLAAGTLLCVRFGPDLLGYPRPGHVLVSLPLLNHRHPSTLHSWVAELQHRPRSPCLPGSAQNTPVKTIAERGGPGLSTVKVSECLVGP